MSRPHIRNERTTRETFGLVGNGIELGASPATDRLCRAWCGFDASCEWFYRSIDHAALTAGLQPCEGCITNAVFALLLAAGMSGPVTLHVKR